MDSPQRRVRVVIVDDDALVRAALRLILESDSGVTVLGEGSDGRSGYDAARSLRPDVVLMDLHMPGTDGVWATAQIAADCPDTKVLVLTAFDTDAMDRLVEAAVEATPQRRAFPETVTDRERQVALLVAQGLGNGEIAEELAVGASTVKTHVSALLDKFGVTNRVQLAVAVAECAEAAL